jgi:hypothetical protein
MPDIEKIREEHSEFRDSLEHETDRGACLIASSYLEYSLERLIRAKLIDEPKSIDKLFEFSGPLGTFSSRIELGYALGLIGEKAKRDLNFIRKIRNEFAHDFRRSSFNESPIREICNEFYYNTPDKSGDRRNDFIATTTGLFAAITIELNEAKRITKAEDIDFDEKILKAIEKMKEMVAEAKKREK